MSLACHIPSRDVVRKEALAVSPQGATYWGFAKKERGLFNESFLCVRGVCGDFPSASPILAPSLAAC